MEELREKNEKEVIFPMYVKFVSHLMAPVNNKCS